MPFAPSDSVEIYYEAHGAGPAIVFIHGGNGNTLCWFNQVAHFAKRYTCITVDLRGFKHSRCPLELCHPRYYVDDLLAVFRHAGIDRAALVCQSHGAWAGVPFTVKHPDRVCALVISSSPTPIYSKENWSVLEKSVATSLAVQRGELPKAQATGISPRFMQERPALTFLYEAIGRLNGPRRTAAMLDEEIKIHPGALASYRTPTLVTGGRHDTFMTPDHHLHVASLIPGAHSHTFQHSGHSAYYEEPEEFNRVIGSFLQPHLSGT